MKFKMCSICQNKIEYKIIDVSTVVHVNDIISYSIIDFASNSRHSADDTKNCTREKIKNQFFELMRLRVGLDVGGWMPMCW